MYIATSSPAITNSIFWGNAAPTGSQIHVSSGAPSITYCDVQDGWVGAGNISSDPLFVRKASAGNEVVQAAAGGDEFVEVREEA